MVAEKIHPGNPGWRLVISREKVMTNAVRAIVLSLVAVWITATAQSADVQVVVLDTQSVWHAWNVLKPPVVQLDGGLKTITSTHEWLDRETPAAPADWTRPEFDDSTWLRGSAVRTCQTSYLADLCLRARFEVTDPEKVKDLKLSAAYYGGAIVYVNGVEVGRANLPKEGAGPAALAEGYPPEAFVNDKGEIVPFGWNIDKKAMAARERTLADVAIPAKALRKGTNVIAVEIIRAPYSKLVEVPKEKIRDKADYQERQCPYDLSWNTCEIRRVQLVAAGAEGLVPNAARPKELQAWNGDLLGQDFCTDFGDRCEALRPVAIQGARNGMHSGKVVIGMPKAIEGLKVICGDLKMGDAVIPAAQTRARFAVPFGDKSRLDTVLDTLLEAPLETFPVGAGGAAVVPIWLTVKVPKDAKPGTYTGQATIEAKGEKAIPVPVSLAVADFALPDTQDYRTWMDLMESPDTLAAEYNVPLWSERHWAMIGDAFRHIGQMGARMVYVPLIAQTNSGNEQSMVRFIPKGDGTYDYDFTVLDKYLDAAQKNMGTPKITAFIAWEIYLQTPKQEVKVDPNEGSFVVMERSWQAARWDLRGKGPAVTALDPATGQTSTIYLPRYEDPNAKAIWKPLFDELHKRMAKRGLEKTMCLGMANDTWANKEEMATLQEVSGNLPWVRHTHGGHLGQKLNGLADDAYVAYVCWSKEYPNDPSAGRTYGWKRPETYVEFRRGGGLNDCPPTTLMLWTEINIAGPQRGMGRIGSDFWPVIRDKQGRRRGSIWEKYPQSLWHSLNLGSYLLLPGPDGPVASTRFEQVREGVQQCEARIAIERALTDEALKTKIGADLASRGQVLVDERLSQALKAFSTLQLTGRAYSSGSNCWYYGHGGLAGHYWYEGSGWRERMKNLYDLAGEVERKLAEK
jgi:hypothetical protein